MKKLFVLSGLSLGLASVPFFASAAGGCTSGNIQTGTIQALVCKIGDLLNLIIPIMIVLGIVFFVWGVISYVIGGDEEAKKKGRSRMIWGIIGLVVIVGMWGLVSLVTTTFNLNNNVNVETPHLPI